MAAQDISTLGTQPIKFPTIDNNSDLSSAIASIRALQESGKSANEMALEGQYAERTKELEGLYAKAGEIGNRETQLRQEQDISGLTSQLQDVRSQIAAKQGALGLGKIQLEKTTRPLEAVRGEQELLDRQATAELTALSAREAALTGNIGLANDLITKTLQLEYKPIEDKINATLKVLDINKDLLSGEQKKRADALTIILNQQKQNLDEQKSLQSKVIARSFQYPDAGILPTDSIEVANAKVLASPSYKTQRQKELQNSTGMKNDKLTLEERKSIYPNLPLSLVGRDEKTVISELEGNEPTNWYYEMLGINTSLPITPVARFTIKPQWETFRKSVLDTMNKQTIKRTNIDEGGA